MVSTSSPSGKVVLGVLCRGAGCLFSKGDVQLAIIEKINRIDQELTVAFEGRSVVYDFGDLDELMLAYAMSIHKSQGSEYPCVVIPLHTQHYLMLQRNLLYTAVTRGKKLVVLVGTNNSLAMCGGRTRVAATPIYGEGWSKERIDSQFARDDRSAPGGPGLRLGA